MLDHVDTCASLPAYELSTVVLILLQVATLGLLAWREVSRRRERDVIERMLAEHESASRRRFVATATLVAHAGEVSPRVLH